MLKELMENKLMQHCKISGDKNSDKFCYFRFWKKLLMVRTNIDNLIINYTHVVHYNGRVWDP